MAKGLGRGINVFFPDLDVKEEETIQEIIVTELRPNPYQPRKHFNKVAIEELAASIKEHGILQPLIARKSIKGYEIVAGERRYRAAKEAGLEKVPAVVRQLNEQTNDGICFVRKLTTRRFKSDGRGNGIPDVNE